MNILPAALAAVGLLLVSAPAQAAAPRLTVDDGQRQVEVRFGDLRLETRNGAEVLVDRIHAAAETVCGPAPSSLGELNAQAEFRKCVRRTMDTAVRQVPVPEVIAVYHMNWG